MVGSWRNGEYVAVNAVETLCNVSCKFEVLLLVDPHGNEVSLIQQDIRSHQNRVGEQTGVDVVRVLCGLILELRHSGKLAELGVAGKDPA